MLACILQSIFQGFTMFKGDLYRNINDVQRRVSKELIEEFSPRMKFRPNGHDSLLDIGCGTGDVTRDFILPVLPQQFSRLVGVDISDSMLSVARETLQNAKVSFENLDIGSPTIDQRVWSELFDHITSFFCLHLVRNQRQAFVNIHNLLTPGGNCLLGYLSFNPAAVALHEMAQKPQWALHRKDMDRFIPTTQWSTNPIDEITHILSDIGYLEYNIQIKEGVHVIKEADTFKCKFYC